MKTDFGVHIPVLWHVAMAVGLFGALCPQGARAATYDSDEYTVAPAGVNLAFGYFQYAHRSEYRTNVNLGRLGVRNIQVPKSKLDSELGIARLLHFSEILGHPDEFQLIVPFGSLNSAKVGGANLPNASGVADPILIFTVWPYYNEAAKTTLGFSEQIFPPIGSYDKKKPLNLGNNRWEYIQQVGFTQGITDHILISLGGDVTFFGDNTEANALNYRLTETPSYSLQAWLRYKPAISNEIAIGWASTLGGIQKEQRVRTGSTAETHTVRFDAFQFLTPTLQVQVGVESDVSVPAGFKRDIFTQLRVFKIF